MNIIIQYAGILVKCLLTTSLHSLILSVRSCMLFPHLKLFCEVLLPAVIAQLMG